MRKSEEKSERASPPRYFIYESLLRLFCLVVSIGSRLISLAIMRRVFRAPRYRGVTAAAAACIIVMGKFVFVFPARLLRRDNHDERNSSIRRDGNTFYYGIGRMNGRMKW